MKNFTAHRGTTPCVRGTSMVAPVVQSKYHFSVALNAVPSNRTRFLRAKLPDQCEDLALHLLQWFGLITDQVTE